MTSAGTDQPTERTASPTPPRAQRATQPGGSPRLGARELAFAGIAAVLLAVLTSWPLVLHLPSRIAPDLGDPVRTAWQVAWVGHAMLNDPAHLFDANAFYPHPLSLAFSDSLLGYGPTAFLGSGTVAALVRYNLLFLFAWSLCFFGAYLLARELSLGRAASTVAAVAFAYAPYRVTEAGHLHVISSGGIPLALFLLLRGYRRSSTGLVFAGWLVSAWQISLGFTLGLQYSYLLLALAATAVWFWWRAGRPLPPRRMVIVTCAGLAVLGVVVIYQMRPYLQVAHDYPTAKRTLREVRNYSSGPAAFLAASTENRLWGSATSVFRDHVNSKNESVLFPGLGITILALLGLGAAVFDRRLRIGLGIGVLVSAIVALGLGLTGAGYPYRLLYEVAPGWDGVRVPGRVFTTTTLFLALLAGAGAQRLLSAAARRTGGAGVAGASIVPALLGGTLALVLLVEGAGHLADPLVPQPVHAEVALRGPLIDLPTDGASDRVWQYFSTNGFPRIADGNSTFDLPAANDLRGGMGGFPDRSSIAKLRYYGIHTVVLHTELPKLPGLKAPEVPEPTDPRAAAAKPITGLGITRRRFGSVYIYEIGPGPAALHASNRS